MAYVYISYADISPNKLDEVYELDELSVYGDHITINKEDKILKVRQYIAPSVNNFLEYLRAEYNYPPIDGNILPQAFVLGYMLGDDDYLEYIQSRYRMLNGDDRDEMLKNNKNIVCLAVEGDLLPSHTDYEMKMWWKCYHDNPLEYYLELKRIYPYINDMEADKDKIADGLLEIKRRLTLVTKEIPIIERLWHGEMLDNGEVYNYPINSNLPNFSYMLENRNTVLTIYFVDEISETSVTFLGDELEIFNKPKPRYVGFYFEGTVIIPTRFGNVRIFPENRGVYNSRLILPIPWATYE